MRPTHGDGLRITDSGCASSAPCSPAPAPAAATLADVCELPLHIALYSNSQGNYFFHEMRDLLASGLEKLGIAVSIRNECHDFAEEADYHIVIAPHEFFYLGAGGKLRDQSWPANLVLINTEQPSTRWFQLARHCFERAAYIWDIDYESARRNKDAGYPCDYLPLGFVDGAELARPVTRLPRHEGTCFLNAAERCRSYLHDPLERRPIDLLFVGSPTPRREQFFGAAAPILSRYRCYIYFSDGSTPVLPGKNTFMNTATVVGLAQRSKILLNVHRGADCYFEWQRIVMQGIAQRTLVISEVCSMAPPFVPGADFVETTLADLANKVDYYLCGPDGLREAQAIVDRGYQTLTERCNLEQFLQTLLSELISQARVLQGFDNRPALQNRVTGSFAAARKQAV